MKARGDASRPPTTAMMKPMYVLQMNWWHWSDEIRIKWLYRLRDACFATIAAANAEIKRLERNNQGSLL